MKILNRKRIQAQAVQVGRILIVPLIVISSVYPQGNTRLLLEKKSGPEQLFWSSSADPENEIKAQWNKSFKIRHVTYREKTWTVLMEKDESDSVQQVWRNPTMSFLNEKITDGYEITDMTFYPTRVGQDTFVVLTKNNPGGTFWMFNARTQTSLNLLADTIQKEGYDKGYIVKFVKSNGAYWDARFGLVMVRKPDGVEQISRYRQDPNDLIVNMSSEGYRLTSLSYHIFQKSWLVIMTKSPAASAVEWYLADYSVEKAKVEDFLKKGYKITRVF